MIRKRAADLMGSPRGRRLCVELINQIEDGELSRFLLQVGHPKSSRFVEPKGRPQAVVDYLAHIDIDSVARLSPSAIRAAMADVTDWAWYWQPPDDDDVLCADPLVIAALQPIAEALWRSAYVDWWSDPVDLSGQRWVQWFDPQRGWWELPQLDAGVDYLRQWRDRAVRAEARERDSVDWRRVSGEWWSTPVFSGAPHTTSTRYGLAALGLELVEDDMGWSRTKVWAVTVDRAARVYEIDSPQDWANLVADFPLVVAKSRRGDWYRTTGQDLRWLIPDWLAVADEYDAVHLTVTGYLTSAGTAIPIGDDERSASVIAGWEPDVTYWLRRDMIELTEPPTEHELVDDQDGFREWPQT